MARAASDHRPPSLLIVVARTLDPETGRRISLAAVQLLSDSGYRGVTVEGVARRAGVSRSTVYRRYAGVDDLIAAAVADVLPVGPGATTTIVTPDGDSWTRFVESLRRALFEGSEGLTLLASLLVAERDEPELLELWRRRVVTPRVEALADALGCSSSEARPLAELAFGGLIARFIGRGRASEADALEMAEMLRTHVRALTDDADATPEANAEPA